jgi:DNA-binding CsgD family transcriptional regulator
MPIERNVPEPGLAARRGGTRLFCGAARAGSEGTRQTPLRLAGISESVSQPPSPDVLVLQAVSRALMAWDPLEPGARHLLAEMATALALPAAVLWRPREGDLLPLASWTADQAAHRAFEQQLTGPDASRFSRLAEFSRERVGPVLDTGVLGDDPAQERSSDAKALRAVVAVPAQAGAETIGVVVGYRADVADFAAPSLETLGAVAQMLGGLLQRWQFQEDHAKLTPRELELVTLASRGLTTAKIAAQLSLSPWTVKTHFEHIRLKLEAPDRAAAVAHALRTGMIV